MELTRLKGENAVALTLFSPLPIQGRLAAQNDQKHEYHHYHHYQVIDIEDFPPPGNRNWEWHSGQFDKRILFRRLVLASANYFRAAMESARKQLRLMTLLPRGFEN